MADWIWMPFSVDEDIIAEQFAQYFSKLCANNTTSGSERLAHEYRIMRSQYVGQLFNNYHLLMPNWCTMLLLI